MASKTNEKRGNHPRIGTQAFAYIARERGFREVAPSEDLRKQKETARKKKWILKRRKENAERKLDVHELDTHLLDMELLDMESLDVELSVEQQKLQGIDSKILARIEFAFEHLRYVMSRLPEAGLLFAKNY